PSRAERQAARRSRPRAQPIRPRARPRRSPDHRVRRAVAPNARRSSAWRSSYTEHDSSVAPIALSSTLRRSSELANATATIRSPPSKERDHEVRTKQTCDLDSSRGGVRPGQLPKLRPRRSPERRSNLANATATIRSPLSKERDHEVRTK